MAQARPPLAKRRRPGARQSPAHRPRKRFGQNFLEPVWAAKVADAIRPERDEVFVEIGPGHGALTRLLVPRVRRMVAVEIDRDLAAVLRDEEVARLTVITGDFLELSARDLLHHLDELTPGERLRVAGNLPYNVASPILFALVKMFAEGVPFTDAVIMLQREVADRLLAPPSTRDYGVLTVGIRQWADVDRVLELPPGAFRPAPKVHSTIVRLRFHQPNPAARNATVLTAVTRAIFTRRRKTLRNALEAYQADGSLTPEEALRRAGIDGSRRPETLGLPELVALADAYSG